ncbi:membrane integrity-associated transporter subunit PqiC [Albirhodobacter sp. R86504]|uniref:PqiC family protein n=1 Tax=Albirhodobacter sp. R86504 TaxID=3093848 RepID=UPI00366CBDD7
MTRFAMLILPLALIACSNPEATGRYLIETPTVAKTLPNRLGSVELREVSLPDYAAGQEVSWQTADGAVRSNPDQVWADAQPRAVTLALARQISGLSGATVIAEPWPLAEAPSRRLEVRVEQILARADGQFRLAGQYFVTPDLGGRGADVVRRFDISVPIGTQGEADPQDPALIAKAQAAALQVLAQQIAQLQ